MTCKADLSTLTDHGHCPYINLSVQAAETLIVFPMYAHGCPHCNITHILSQKEDM